MLANITKEFVLSAVLVPIVVALIAGPVVAVIKRLDNNNTNQHARSIEALELINQNIDTVKDSIKDVKTDVGLVQLYLRDVQHDVKNIDSRLNEHIDWHLKKKEGV
jgi:septal ring factor EnvC (AmiA/AmiB activator)